MTSKTSRSGYSDRDLMYTVDPYVKGDHAVIRQVQDEAGQAESQELKDDPSSDCFNSPSQEVTAVADRADQG